ncbi:hypothetical protein [Kitasatospora purpeofusca]|uniref:hypothetical protein n=1 Tax=Kitasatospora purpeofusca TaxID=67352 RepID=UPI003867CDE4|nr:hypothetical protein OIP63_00110 [Kitasatospora purpeofusca]
MTTSTQAGLLTRWEIQYRSDSQWRSSTSGMVGDDVPAKPLAAAVLACHLMTVDHEADLDDYRTVVRRGLGAAEAIVDEDALAELLGEAGYYARAARLTLRTVLNPLACRDLPPFLTDQLDRIGVPGPVG